MMLDVIKIRTRAGNGGDGRVSFLHLKHQPKAGPDGGDGGNGGNVYLVLSPNHKDLSHLSHRFLYEAESGQSGGKNKKSGRSGQDLVIPVPEDTYVWQVPADFKLKGNISRRLKENSRLLGIIDKTNPKLLVARGGRGGLGNWHFRSSTNQAPQIAEKGGQGEDKTIVLELKLLADIGLIGLPNAGKSSLLKKLTSAQPKVANYPFTTITPHLGILTPRHWGVSGKKIILIDIPGLIKGASRGKGLGYQFLRHIQKTKLLVHLIEPVLNSQNQAELDKMKTNYLTIRQELKKYGFGLEKKPELIVISKKDLIDDPQVFKKLSFNSLRPLLVSIYDDSSLRQLVKTLVSYRQLP